MGLVSDKLEAMEAEVVTLTAKLASGESFVGEFEAGANRKRFILSDPQRARAEKRLGYLESQISQLSTVFGSRTLAIKSRH